MKLSNLITRIESTFVKTNLPNLKRGSRVTIHFVLGSNLLKNNNFNQNSSIFFFKNQKVDLSSIQKQKRQKSFQGIITKIHRSNLSSTITLKKMSKTNAFGGEVQRTFFLHSPEIESIEINETKRS